MVSHETVISSGACCWMARPASSWPYTQMRAALGAGGDHLLGMMEVHSHRDLAPVVAETPEKVTTGA